MPITSDDPGYERYMQDFIKKSKVKWHRCKKCNNWISRPKEVPPCPLCPPNREKKKTDEDAEVYDPVTKSYVPKGLF